MNQQRRKRSRGYPLWQVILLSSLSGIVCFYFGLLAGSTNGRTAPCATEQEIQRRIRREAKAISKKLLVGRDAPGVEDTAKRFPSTIYDFTVGASRVERQEFASELKMGLPLDKNSANNNEVLVLYSDEQALPNDPFLSKEALSMTTIPTTTVKNALQNCDYLNVILTHHSPRRQCIALFGQYEAFHVQKYMRLPESGALNTSMPLRFVNRGASAVGRKSTRPPSKTTTRRYWTTLQKYLSHLDTALESLKPIAEKVQTNNAIVVLVCNKGQSELLMNFLCSSQRRALDLSHILVFATDVETRDLVESFGVAAFHDDAIFSEMPKDAARRYADKNFMLMMMAKVYCVQLITMLGYDVLFQDVDVIWYRDPLPYFHNTSASDFDYDVYFQDDGNHAIYYAPYSANTGFYYVRNNERTQHFFNSFLLAGDLIIGTKSHQVPLVALLQEHASMYGLKIKIFSRDEDQFPGGHAYHRRKDYMKDLISGKVHPYIFHMSWTLNKKNKIAYYEQMGEWYLQSNCVQKTVEEIFGGTNQANYADHCCSAEALVQCHYRDKPSKIPCRDNDPINKGAGSFW